MLLLHFPNIVGFQQFSKAVVRFLGTYLFYLCLYRIVVGGCLHITDYTQCDGESIVVSHQGQLELERVVLAMSIVDQDIVDRNVVLTNFHDFQRETVLHQSVLLLVAKDERFSMFDVDCILGTCSRGVNGVVSAIIEDDTVLQDFAYAGSLVIVSSLQNLDGSWSVCRNGTSEEMATCTKAKLSGSERILHSSVRT